MNSYMSGGPSPQKRYSGTLFCTPTFSTPAGNTFKMNALYPTYAECLTDMSKVSCSTAPTTYAGSMNMYASFGRVTCNFGTQTFGSQQTGSATLIFDFANAASSYLPYVGMGSSPTPSGCTDVNINAPYNQASYPPAAVAAAVSAVFSPAVLCAPFAPNANPPYICTGNERQSLLSIILQALSLYATAIGLLTAAVPVLLSLPSVVLWLQNAVQPKKPAVLSQAAGVKEGQPLDVAVADGK